ncbi:MAG TPA: class I SAM-dependent methyltransferase [Anaerolineales bacterium]|nr:class I SAM-dependent methyltransferase [Anaerolineales bacterium]HIQ01007.1 class I SAM-dependent methyltransferase [Anaerolineales bacterium]
MVFPSARDRRGWERIWADPSALSDYWREPEPAVLEWVRGLAEGARLLDLGCGVGRHTVPLVQMGLKVVGGDISPSGLAACAARLRQVGLLPLLVRHDMTRLPFADGAFDALLSFHVVYHTTRQGLRAVLAEARRVLRSGGRLYLTFLGRVEENIARQRTRNLEPGT